jgi:hypothetical protein
MPQAQGEVLALADYRIALSVGHDHAFGLAKTLVVRFRHTALAKQY